MGRSPTYLEWFGLWLNRRREQYREMSVVANGVMIGLGMMTPGKSYYESITDGKGEAMLLQGSTEAARGMSNG